ncbi:MAG: hypothetical protein K2I76_04135 [Malacoplasma sp.]|nr:hypothetical protein [Malacoplasma sp.]
MKKRKKILMWISFLGVSVSTISAPVAFSNLNKNIVENKIQNKNTDFVDYKQTSDFLKNEFNFKSILKNNKFSMKFKNFNNAENLDLENTEIVENLTDEQIQLMNKKQNELLEYFEEKNYTLNQINDYLFERYPEYKEEYLKNLDDLKEENLVKQNEIIINRNRAVLYSSEPNYATENNLNELVNTLKTLKITFTALAAGAAIAAVASFLCGNLILGVSLTTISCVLGASAAGVDIGLAKYDESRSNWKNAILLITDVYKLGRLLYSIAYAWIVTANATITASTYIFPAFLAITGLVSIALTLLEIFK